ncbi:MAG TPA: FtsX-like permease family protein [Longimicrobium sp.]|jgi:putative ABC transport system permease protein
MRALNRKLLRDLWRLRGQVLSIALVVAAGVATVVTFRSTFDSLEASRDLYYRESRFADVFAGAKRAPEPVARRLAELPGVSAVDTRVVATVALDVPGVEETATGRLVSIPAGGGALNRLHLRGGRLPSPGRAGEALVSEQFARANRLAPGDSVGAVIEGRWERLAIVGIALSPEYVYEAQPGFFYTDNRRFGVLWMNREALAAASGMRGAFNDVALDLAPGAREAEVLAGVDRVLAPFGGVGAYGRADQLSNHVIEDEIRQNRVTGTVLPALFLAVAAFLLNVVLGRMVSTEREEIAVLKAFGYSNLRIGRHYLRLALAAVAIASVLGVAAGVWLGSGMIGLYAEHMRSPVLRYRASWGLVAGAVAASAFAAALGALGAVRRAVRLPPAEAMRPEAPGRFARAHVEALFPAGLLSTSGRIVVRNLTRRPLRTAGSVLMVALAVSILVVSRFFQDAVRFAADVQFRGAQRQELTVAFNAPRGGGAALDLARIPGVTRVEPFRSVPVRLRAGGRWRQVALQGVVHDAQLQRVVDARRRPYAIPPAGALLSTQLASTLGVAPGDTVTAEVLEGERRELRVVVAGTADEMFGINAYMELDALNRLLREPPTISGAHLDVEDGGAAAVHARLKRTPLVAGVSSPASMLASFESHVAANMNTTMAIVSLFAGVIALGVVYNGARVALSERGRELASLRVLGFTGREIAVILLGEQAVITVAGLLPGFALGVGYCALLLRVINGELYRLPLFVSPPSLLLATGVVLVAAAGAGLAVRRRLRHLDLIAVLKTRE